MSRKSSALRRMWAPLNGIVGLDQQHDGTVPGRCWDSSLVTGGFRINLVAAGPSRAPRVACGLRVLSDRR